MLASLPVCSASQVTSLGIPIDQAVCRANNGWDFLNPNVRSSDLFADAFPRVFGGSPPTPVTPSAPGVPVLMSDGSYLRPDGTTSSAYTLGPESDYEARMQAQLKNYDERSGVLSPVINIFSDNPNPINTSDLINLVLVVGGAVALIMVLKK